MRDAFLILFLASVAFVAVSSSSYYGKKALISYNYPDYVVAWDGPSVYIKDDDNTYYFRIVKGLNEKHHTISFQSLYDSNYYIRHKSLVVNVEKDDSSHKFKEDASFNLKVDKFFNGFAAFESSNFPGYYLRHQGYQIKLHQIDGSDLFKKDASFYVSTPLSSVTCDFYETIMCEPNLQIKINSADIGWQNASVCSVPSTTKCPLKSVLTDAIEICEGETFCKISTANYYPNRECRGIRKYMQVHYQCVPHSIVKKKETKKKASSYKKWLAIPAFFLAVIFFLCKDRNNRTCIKNRIKNIFKRESNQTANHSCPLQRGRLFQRCETRQDNNTEISTIPKQAPAVLPRHPEMPSALSSHDDPPPSYQKTLHILPPPTYEEAITDGVAVQPTYLPYPLTNNQQTVNYSETVPPINYPETGANGGYNNVGYNNCS
ncbi:uncharacterized protein LOC130630532 [Hydractinia symbiolongicarpus]|uniref:uncharacterized protein LOC130630532 n=1 Tax=Hydractinia symbiolongicarpus TaxID=13093 RepID=UPI00254CF84C|nr:uncharacterized protein LOC130630532 [Hydractinia symbiolongicarpus]